MSREADGARMPIIDLTLFLNAFRSPGMLSRRKPANQFIARQNHSLVWNLGAEHNQWPTGANALVAPINLPAGHLRPYNLTDSEFSV